VHVGQAVHIHLLPFDEVPVLDGVEGMQLIDLRLAGHGEGQWFGAFQVDLEVAGEHAAAQLEADERADIGLGDTQVDVARADIELGGDRRQVDLAGGL